MRVFGEDILQLGSRFIANLSLGYDHWSDFRARQLKIDSGGTTLTPYPDRISDALNPRPRCSIALEQHVADRFGLSRLPRPTLNELYRNFYQGNILTMQPCTGAERLTGVEAGVRQGFFPTGSICVRRSFGTTSPMAS